MTVQSTILKDIALVIASITIWSGAKKLEPSDFINVDVDDLPSSRVATYGIKHLINKDRLQPFKTLRGKAERLCAKYGTRLMGGYAIPQDCIDLISQELKIICDEFEGEIVTFMSEYDKAISEWIKDNPGFEEPLRRAMLPQAEVRSRFRASYSIFEVSSSPRDRTNSLAAVGTDLLDSVFNGVANTLKPLIERKVGGAADSFRVEVRQSIGDVASKIRRFSFMDPSGGMMKLADKLDDRVVGEGKIRDEEFKRLWGLLNTLNSVQSIKNVVSSLGSQITQQATDQSASGSLPLETTINSVVEEPGFDPVELDDAFAAFDSAGDLEAQEVPDQAFSEKTVSAEEFFDTAFPIQETEEKEPTPEPIQISVEPSEPWTPNFGW